MGIRVVSHKQFCQLACGHRSRNCFISFAHIYLPPFFFLAQIRHIAYVPVMSYVMAVWVAVLLVPVLSVRAIRKLTYMVVWPLPGSLSVSTVICLRNPTLHWVV